MARVIEDAMVETVVRVLLGAVDVDGGATDEQRAALGAVVAGYWERPDLDLTALSLLDPAGAAAAVTEPAHRRRVRELMVMLELCRHPLSDAQVTQVEEYAAALGETGPGLALARRLVNDGAAAAAADYLRFLGDKQQEFEEPTLRGRPAGSEAETANAELLARLRELHDLPEDTLGYQYVEFYRRNGIELPGEDPNQPAVFVSHDMCHVIAGYEPTGQGEIALGAMQLALDDTDVHWLAFLGNLSVHEAGFLGVGDLVPKQATMTREGAPEMLARAFARGAQCTGDFTTADHLALAATPIADVRAQFGVPPL
jgi:Coenzyme Q (ubiquinone) biosynthesis protein Coq4